MFLFPFGCVLPLISLTAAPLRKQPELKLLVCMAQISGAWLVLLECMFYYLLQIPCTVHILEKECLERTLYTMLPSLEITNILICILILDMFGLRNNLQIQFFCVVPDVGKVFTFRHSLSGGFKSPPRFTPPNQRERCPSFCIKCLSDNLRKLPSQLLSRFLA